MSQCSGARELADTAWQTAIWDKRSSVADVFAEPSD